MIVNLRVGFDQRTVARLAEIIQQRNEIVTREGADDAGQKMVKEARLIIKDERKPSDGAVRKPRKEVRPLGELYVYKVLRTPMGYRSYLTNTRTANQSERGKFFMNELGSRKTQFKGDSGRTRGRDPRPGRFIARRARDRVYQRIRRGTV